MTMRDQRGPGLLLAGAHRGRARSTRSTPSASTRERRRIYETFYGQLALARIEENPTLRLQAVSHEATRDDELAFEADERVQAIRALSPDRRPVSDSLIRHPHGQ